MRITPRYGALVGLCTLLMAPNPSLAAARNAGRVSDVSGRLAVHGIDEDAPSYAARNTVIREGDTFWTDERGRAEIELPGGGWLRLAEDTKVELRSLDSGGEFRVLTGSVWYDGRRGTRSAVWIRVPEADCEAPPGAVVRIDLSADNRARFSVFRAGLRVELETGQRVALRPHQRVYLDAGRVSEGPEPFDYDDLDDFDRYHRTRVSYYDHRPQHPYLDRDLVGSRDLEGYGSWTSYRGSRYWRPRTYPGWRPYSHGYWSYDPGCGYSWIDDEPWGYTTSHYGRWVYRPAIGGWCWAPGYVLTVLHNSATAAVPLVPGGSRAPSVQGCDSQAIGP